MNDELVGAGYRAMAEGWHIVAVMAGFGARGEMLRMNPDGRVQINAHGETFNGRSIIVTQASDTRLALVLDRPDVAPCVRVVRA